MFKKQKPLFAGLLIVLLIAAAGCKSKYEKLKASNDNSKKYQEAVKLYNKKEYSKALGLFEPLLTRYRGQDGAEDLFYYNADATYKIKDYTAASFFFKEFAKNFSTSPRAEEARFLTAYCLYLEAPNFSLDQSNTLKSIEALQLFINLYPKSERVAEASKLIQNLRDKLEEKAYANAKLYYVTTNYQAAVIAFGNTLRDYPDTKYGEELEFLTVKAQYEYANHSREIRQEDRYEQAITFADMFTEKFPTSKYLPEIKEIKLDSQDGIRHAKQVLVNAANDEKLARKLAKKDTVATPTPSVKMDIHQKIPN
jgi:outer membrane protein assembly factor BamD